MQRMIKNKALHKSYFQNIFKNIKNRLVKNNSNPQTNFLFFKTLKNGF